ncbi:MAG: NfeD family protein [Patescibacteria group bacterium]
MPIFIALAIAGIIWLASSLIFGHDHDVSTDTDHDTTIDHEGTSETTISIFSTKVIATGIMVFGAAGAIARYYNVDIVASSLIGILFGVIVAGLMFFGLSLMYKQQGTSLIPTSATIGLIGSVVTSISKNGIGEISVTVYGAYKTYLARSQNGEPIEKGRAIKIVGNNGSELLVTLT